MTELDEADRQERIRSTTDPRPRATAQWRSRRETMSLYLAVTAGSVIGSVLRALASLAAIAWFGQGFPWGTLFVNVLGSFVIGFYATLTGPGGRIFAGTIQRQFVMTGICGGFTTFSLFSLEVFQSLRSGDLASAGLYVAVSLVTWFAAIWLGHMFASRLNRLGGS